MDIQKSDKDGITVFTIEGRIDSTGATEFDEALQAAVVGDEVKIIVDMSGVRYINSSGLRVLADVLTQCRDKGGDLRLVALSPKVQRVFEIIGFNNFFTTYDNLSSAALDF